MSDAMAKIIWIPIYLLGAIINGYHFNVGIIESIIMVIFPFAGGCVIAAIVLAVLPGKKDKYYLLLASLFMLSWIGVTLYLVP